MDIEIFKPVQWIDPSPAYFKIRKMSIVDIRPYVFRLGKILLEYKVIEDLDEVENYSLEFTIKIIKNIIDLSKAWVHGEDSYCVTVNILLDSLTVEMNSDQRERFKKDLDDPKKDKLNKDMFEYLKSIINEIDNKLNKNRYVFHKLKEHQNKFVVIIEQYDDYRVIQWTRNELEKLEPST